MLRINRILHATDFSPPSMAALSYAAMLARRLRSSLDVIHVTPGIGMPSVTVYQEDASCAPMSEHNVAVLEGFRAVHAQSAGAGVTIRRFLGKGPLPGPVIIHESMRQATDLIVLGAHGGGEAEADKVGSVAADILRRSTCPVFIVPSDARPETVDDSITRIAALVSYTRLIKPVVTTAAQFADLFGARLDVLAEVDGRDVGAAALDEVNRTVSSILHDSKIEVHGVHSHGAHEVVEFARSERADMLLVEAPGLASMDAPSEQTVEEIVGRSPCPVMLINTCRQGPTRSATHRMRHMSAAPA